MPILAARTSNEGGTEVVGLFGDAMRRAVQTFAAGEGYLVGWLLSLSGGDFFARGRRIALWGWCAVSKWFLISSLC